MKVIVVNGYPESGKSTWEEYCGELLPAGCYGRRSTVDKVKELALECGWDGQKDLRGRRFLSELKRLLTEYDDIPFKDISKAIRAFEMDLVAYGLDASRAMFFVDAREPQAIEQIKNAFDAVTVLVDRPVANYSRKSNSSDTDVMNYDYDYIIKNNGDLNDLKDAAKAFVAKVIKNG